MNPIEIHHMPSTALPWTEQSVYAAGSVGSKKTTFISQGISGADSDYMLHACNAYPKLIAFVRELKRGNLRAHDAYFLLRELGEDK